MQLFALFLCAFFYTLRFLYAFFCAFFCAFFYTLRFFTRFLRFFLRVSLHFCTSACTFAHHSPSHHNTTEHWLLHSDRAQDAPSRSESDNAAAPDSAESGDVDDTSLDDKPLSQASAAADDDFRNGLPRLSPGNLTTVTKAIEERLGQALSTIPLMNCRGGVPLERCTNRKCFDRVGSLVTRSLRGVV